MNQPPTPVIEPGLTLAQYHCSTIGAGITMKIASCVSALILLPFEAISQQVVYDIDFQTPDQMVDQAVRTGAAPDHVSRIDFFAPRVVTGFGALAEQPLLFSSLGQSPSAFGYYYTQIGLSMAGVQASTLDLAFDFVDLGAGHFFTILFDTPTEVDPFVNTTRRDF